MPKESQSVEWPAYQSGLEDAGKSFDPLNCTNEVAPTPPPQIVPMGLPISIEEYKMLKADATTSNVLSADHKGDDLPTQSHDD